MMSLIYIIRNALGMAFLSLFLGILPAAAEIDPDSSDGTPAASEAELGITPAELEVEPAEPNGTPAELEVEPDAHPDAHAWREHAKQNQAEVHVSTQGWLGRKERRVSGVVVGEHLVLTDATFVRDGGEIVVTYPTNPQPLAAEVHSIHGTHPVALLRVNGLERPAAVFSHEGSGSGPGRKITSFGFWAEVPINTQEAQGFVAYPQGNARQQTGSYFSHSATTGYGGYGGGVFNECGQLVGLNVAARAGYPLEMDDVEAPAGAMLALRSTVLTDFLGQAGIATASEDAECFTAQARLEQRLEEAQRQKEAEMAELRERKEAELDEAQRQKEAELTELQRQREAELEEARRQKEAELAELRRQREAEQEEAWQREERLQEAQREKEAELEEARHREEDQLKQRQEEQRAAREKMYWLIGASSGVILLLLFAFLRHRRKKKRELAAAQRRVEKIQEDAQRRFSDCLLQGRNQEGQEINIKLSGKALAQEGIVVGRSLKHSGGVIDDPSVSREHVRLYVSDNTLLIEDLNSMNGTAVNGRKIHAGKAQPIRSGDTVRFGAVDLRVVFG